MKTVPTAEGGHTGSWNRVDRGEADDTDANNRSMAKQLTGGGGEGDILSKRGWTLHLDSLIAGSIPGRGKGSWTATSHDTRKPILRDSKWTIELNI